jgi:carbamate kinase
MRLTVIALGGNAILQPRQHGTVAEQQANIRIACREIAQVVAGGHAVVLVHGNGPQVGNLLLQSEEGRLIVPAMPLDVCGAQTQGMLGYLIQQELARLIPNPVVSLVTQTVVDAADPGFRHPSKPVGPFYTPLKAKEMMRQHGWSMAEDAGRGWRRVVPSPNPIRIVEVEAVRHLTAQGTVVIACGGGGVPVIATATGNQGVEAVIDKDLAAAVLAIALGAQQLVILTDVPAVYIDYGTPQQQALGQITDAEAARLLAEGQFRAGSMQPKVEGCLRFLSQGGQVATITSLAYLVAGLKGEAGTRIVVEEGDSA